MSTLAPSEFIAKAEARGFVFSLKPGCVVNVKPPAPEAMTDTLRAYVRKAKPLLVPLLEARLGTEEPPAEEPSKRQLLKGAVPHESFGDLPSAEQWQAWFASDRSSPPPGGWAGITREKAGLLPLRNIETENAPRSKHRDQYLIEFARLNGGLPTEERQ